jgi:nicotinamidase-related amidase
MKSAIHLLIIDPQNDFCDLPADYLPRTGPTEAQPGLPVSGAHADMQRLGDMIARGLRGLSDISITLDSHHHLGIERPTFWMQGDGSEVSPFTQILASDVRAGKYLPRNPKATARVLAYLDALEAAGRYTLMVWPIHCEIGTWGHNVHNDVRKAYNTWERAELGVVQKVTKGSNPWTEHYSALMAEVPDPKDPTTQLNRGLIDVLEEADLIPVAGEAGSHCVKATVEHIVDNFGVDSIKKLVLLTDCISPVAGFEQQYQDFLADMRGRGLQLASSQDFLAELVGNARK